MRNLVVRRPAVGCIAWLGVGVASGHAWSENAAGERYNLASDDRTRNLLRTQALSHCAWSKENPNRRMESAAVPRRRTVAGAEKRANDRELRCQKSWEQTWPLADTL